MIVSPIVVDEFNLIIDYPEVSYVDWKYFNKELKDVYCAMDTILKCIDIERKDNMRKNYKGLVITTDTFIYKNYLRHYYWYLLHLDNPIEYNKYLDKLIIQHKNNLNYESIKNASKETVQKRQKDNNPKKYKPKNKYYLEERIDMFTNETNYLYYNPVTKDEFYSDNPNLLEELNSKKKIRKTKEPEVPLSNMTFKF